MKQLHTFAAYSMLLILGCFSSKMAAGCTYKAYFNGDSIICSASNGIYTTVKTAGHYYRWAVKGGQIISGAGTSSITVNWPLVLNGIVTLYDSTSTCKDSFKLKVKVGLSEITLQKSSYNRVGSATANLNNQVLTDMKSADEVGAAWCNNAIDLNNDFDFSFIITITNVTYHPIGEGMMFVLQNSGPNSLAPNGTGDALGYYNASSGVFDQSFAVEFDLRKSASNYYDSSDSHLSLVMNKNPKPLRKQVYVSPNLASSYERKFRITWNSDSKTLLIYFDKKLIYTYKNDLVKNIFGGNPKVWFGFTGATTGNYTTQMFRPDSLVYARASIKADRIKLCQGDTEKLTASPGISYLWNTGETTRTIGVTRAGYYYVTMHDSSNCEKTADSIEVQVFPLPKTPADQSIPICMYDSITLGTMANMDYLYNWTSLPEGFFSHNSSIKVSPAEKTTYKYMITDRVSGCFSTSSYTISFNQSPKAFCSISDGCSGTALTITNNSTSPNGAPLTYHWKFGDGTGTVDKYPHKIYENAGAFNAWLVVKTDSGCLDSFYQRVLINPSPVIDIKATAPCEDQSVIFTNYTHVAGGTINSYIWNFGDGTFSSDISPVKKYKTFGVYPVMCTSVSDKGCADSLQIPAIVYPLPKASYSYYIPCVHNNTAFTNTSFIDTSNIISAYKWNFGDGFSSTTKDPVHLYAQAGKYNVFLSVTTDKGCKDISRSTIDIIDPPKAFMASIINPCIGSTVKFNDSSIGKTQDPIKLWSWNFGDKTASVVQSPSHKYFQAGTYIAVLKIKTLLGCADSLSKTVTIYSPPDGTFKAKFIEKRTWSFTADETGLSSYNWDFGDNTFGKGSAINHTYIKDSGYEVSLTAINSTGCTQITSQNITVSGPVAIEGITDNKFHIKISPNPFTTMLNVEYEFENSAKVKITIYDITGKEMVVISNAGLHHCSIKAANYGLIPGIYILRFETNGSAFYDKIIMQ